jgi:hypothetical protein
VFWKVIERVLSKWRVRVSQLRDFTEDRPVLFAKVLCKAMQMNVPDKFYEMKYLDSVDHTAP